MNQVAREQIAGHTAEAVYAGLDRLRDVLMAWDSVLVAFSGGVDSAVVLAVAHEALGARAVAFTAESPTLPAEEAEIAKAICAQLGVRHLVMESNELDREGYRANAGNRCYFCKSELFEIAQRVASEEGIAVVVDGTILDDLGDHRPGLVAAEELQVGHPLVDAQFDKGLVRAAAQHLGLPVWDKPSFACLGSRFPAGTEVTLDRVTKIGRVERLVRLVGVRQFRVRFHEVDGQTMVRIEVGEEDIQRISAPRVRRQLVAACKNEGFHWVTLDLEGYRTGTSSPSMADLSD